MGSILNFIFPLQSEHTQVGPITNYIKSEGYQYTIDSKLLEGHKNVLLIEPFIADSFKKILTDEFASYVLKNNLIVCVGSVIDPEYDKNYERDIKDITKLKKIYDNVVYIDSNTNLIKQENVYTLHYFFEESLRDKDRFFGQENQLGYVSIKIKEEELDSFRNKKFLSFQRNNEKNHRLSLLHDYLTNDFSDSYFSFLQKADASCDIYQGNENLLSTKEYNKQLPIQLDTHGYGHIIDHFRVTDTFPTELFLDSVIHIVSETSFETNEMFISEKILKPILNFQPFILIGPYQYLKELKKIGFKTFGEFWDESYDEIENPKERYLKLREVIIDLNKKSIEELNLLYKKVKHICIYNNKLFYEMEFPDSMKKIFNDIERKSPIQLTRSEKNFPLSSRAKNKKILVTGSSGLVGTHLIHKLIDKDYTVIGVDIKTPINDLPSGDNFQFLELDLRNADIVKDLFDAYEFGGVINAFGIKGSPIRAKENPLDFLEPSIKVNTNIIENSHKHGSWLVFMSSVGVYEPAEVFVEDTVWKTLPSPNDWFPSWSKRIPELYLEAFKVQHKYEKFTIVRPANIFGEYDNFGDGATVIGATCRKVYDATDEIEAWGDGTPTRDFIYAGDVANGCIKCLEDELHITTNLGSGEEISIKRMIETVAKVSGKEIKINWDTSKPNGDMRRCMSTKIQEQYGLLPKLGFEEGIKETYKYYEKNR